MRKIGILIENHFFERELFYYQFRFLEAGFEPVLLSKLWGQDSITFLGNEYRAPLVCQTSFENLTDEELSRFAAIIVPSGFVSDRLRYTEDIDRLPSACTFMQRIFRNPALIKGVICHGLWLFAPIPELVCGRRMTLHNNLLGDAKNMGVSYVNQDVVEDGDLISARTGEHCHLLAARILKRIAP